MKSTHFTLPFIWSLNREVIAVNENINRVTTKSKTRNPGSSACGAIKVNRITGIAHAIQNARTRRFNHFRVGTEKKFEYFMNPTIRHKHINAIWPHNNHRPKRSVSAISNTISMSWVLRIFLNCPGKEKT